MSNEVRAGENYLIYYSNWFQDRDEYYERAVGPLLTGRLKPLLDLRRSAPVLEIGCGPGLALNALRCAGFEDLLGIDVSAEQIAVAQRRGFPAIWVDDPAAWLRTQRSRYSAALAFDVLEHVPTDSLLPMLRTLAEALTDDGAFFGTVPNANHSFSGRVRYGDYTHHVAFTEYSLAYVLENAGMIVSDISAEDSIVATVRRLSLRRLLRTWFRAFRRLEAIAEFGRREGSTIPLSRNLYFIARKR